ncbi:hypothetical protein ACHMW6_30710 [Pseudoduganella sp. UC29_106]|uniref:hypothetical protein n=1 Tax=Pseudoduganella sp. UC29_106 TaxID=3374553 RepID=UPI0037573191
MITFSRTANVAPGKTTEAIKFAKTIQAYLKEGYGIELEVMLPFGGNPLRVAWTGRFDSVAKIDEFQQKMMGDQQYWNIISQYKDCLLPGSVNDSIWRTV